MAMYRACDKCNKSVSLDGKRSRKVVLTVSVDGESQELFSAEFCKSCFSFFMGSLEYFIKRWKKDVNPLKNRIINNSQPGNVRSVQNLYKLKDPE